LFDPDWATHRAVILGCSGTVLTEEEISFFEEARPLGFILFKRNCVAPEQLKELTKSLRSISGQAYAPILIDQEGGRVARLGEPHWRHPPAGRVFGELAERDLESGCEAAYLNARLMGRELQEMGVDIDCAPVLDISQPFAHEIIGDRSYSDDPAIVGEIGNAVSRGLAEEGVTPIIKHIPGHGRARTDSHLELPVIDAEANSLRDLDFQPFAENSHAPWAMTAHILYTALDQQRPATQSECVIRDVIRGEIGFGGVLISDDIGMKALEGKFAERADKSLEAGCDLILHCSGEMDEMASFALNIPEISADSLERLRRGDGWVDEMKLDSVRMSREEISKALSDLLQKQASS